MGKGLHLCKPQRFPFPTPPNLHTGVNIQLSLGQTIASGNTGRPCFPECARVPRFLLLCM